MYTIPIVFIHHCTMYLRRKPKIDYIDYIVILYTFCKQNQCAKTKHVKDHQKLFY